jgi:myo-inositol-1(or 4)-monophosphatase
MSLNLNFLKELVYTVYDNIHDLLGTPEAAIGNKRGAGGDISMNIDLIAEKSIIDLIREREINVKIISEEIGEKVFDTSDNENDVENVLIIDPVDGSNNAARGIPYCSVSIAHAGGKTLESLLQSVVLDLNTKDIYWGIKGKGAYLNNKKLHVSNRDFSQKCFLELDIPKRNTFRVLEQLNPLIMRFHRYRILGSSALTLCQVAKGSMEAFINMRPSNRIMDVAAGFLILNEAGGKSFSVKGEDIEGEFSVNFRFPFIASNATLAPMIKQFMNNITL